MPVGKLVADVAAKERWKYGIEFCGGTHVDRTGNIKELIIIEESGIAKAMRHIVAVTGELRADSRKSSSSAWSECLFLLRKTHS